MALHTDYSQWEREITDQIIERLDCTNGDAQGFLEAHDSLLSEAWIKDMAPMEASGFILSKTKRERL